MVHISDHLVYLGYGVMGLYHKDAPVKVSISAWEWGAYLGEEGLKKGVRVKISIIYKNSKYFRYGKSKISCKLYEFSNGKI